MDNQLKSKKNMGQFFTTTNPFSHPLFFDWLEMIPDLNNKVILEPFCGINSIPEMIISLNIKNQWQCYDIDEKSIAMNKIPDLNININDSLNNFPKGFDIVITNPPYLAKNSAKKNNLHFPEQSNYDDLYKIALNIMLKNVNYVAAIIPESFLNQNLFKERLYGVISLNYKMFSDTEHPVCLALFVKNPQSNFLVYSGFEKLGYHQDFENFINNFLSIDKNYKENIQFNNTNGQLGLNAIDNTKHDNIYFFRGNKINNDKIKISSRNLTKIKIVNKIEIDSLIEECNQILKELRYKTNDLFLTSFKGLRSDGKYRRRLDFRTARKIINKAIINIENKQ